MRLTIIGSGDFIPGLVPAADGVFTGAGWRGTGYKFAPWVGQVLARLALRRDAGCGIGRFSPARFAAGAGPGRAAAGGVTS